MRPGQSGSGERAGFAAAIRHIRNEDAEFRVDRRVTKWNTHRDPARERRKTPLRQADLALPWPAAAVGMAFAMRVLGEMSMRTTFRGIVIDSLMSLAALCVLLAILTAINADLRQQVARQLKNGQVVTTAVSSTRGFATGVYRAARFQTIGYASLVLFVGAAGVLVVFMLRV